MKVRHTAGITFKKGITVGVHPMLKTVSHGDDGKKAEHSQWEGCQVHQVELVINTAAKRGTPIMSTQILTQDICVWWICRHTDIDYTIPPTQKLVRKSIKVFISCISSTHTSTSFCLPKENVHPWGVKSRRSFKKTRLLGVWHCISYGLSAYLAIAYTKSTTVSQQTTSLVWRDPAGSHPSSFSWP